MESKSPQNKIPKIKDEKEQTTPEQKSNHNTHKQTENKNRTKAQITHKKKTRNKNNVGKQTEKKQQMKIITFKATNLKKPTN